MFLTGIGLLYGITGAQHGPTCAARWRRPATGASGGGDRLPDRRDEKPPPSPCSLAARFSPAAWRRGVCRAAQQGRGLFALLAASTLVLLEGVQRTPFRNTARPRSATTTRRFRWAGRAATTSSVLVVNTARAGTGDPGRDRGAMFYLIHNHRLVQLKVTLFLAAGAAAPDPATPRPGGWAGSIVRRRCCRLLPDRPVAGRLPVGFWGKILQVKASLDAGAPWLQRRWRWRWGC